MVEYFGMDVLPGKMFFRCERTRATLSTTSCADMWRRSNGGKGVDTYSHCKCCPIGALHAGEAGASMSPLKGTLTCARCHRTANRLIGKMVCVSCYNRSRELAMGRNAKGTAPVKLKREDARLIRFMAGGEVRSLRVDRSIDTDELIVATLRDSRHSVLFGLAAGRRPQATQAGLQ